MNKYISREKLLEKIDKLTEKMLPDQDGDHCVSIEAVREFIANFDTVDLGDYKKTVGQCINSDYCNGWNDAIAEMSTVKFVTCKDCKFYSGNINDDDLRDGFCCLKDVGYFCKRKFDDYCSRGILCDLNMEK